MSETAISEHGLIGDLQTAALVSTDGSIDWFCCPRFDSPSVFGALLDDEKGGHFRIRPAHRPYTSKQLYLPDTAILVTRFLTEAGVGEVVDFMPVPEGREATDNHRLVRMVRCVRGRMSFDVELAPRFDYGRATHQTEVTGHGAVLTGPDPTLTLHPVREPDDERLAHGTMNGGDLHISLTLDAGQTRGVVLESAADGPPREIRVAEFEQLFDDTVAFWRSWLHQSTYTGRWREAVQRSAITLKLMTYAPTGALVAAPTAALPEQVGGERNWDYRYTWVRDARSRCTPCSGSASPRRSRSSAVAGRPDPRAPGRQRDTAQHHVPGRRFLGPDRGEPGPLVGLPRIATGADRQRRRRAAPARHLRRGTGRHLRRRRGRHPARARRLAGAQRRPGLARRQLGPAGRGHLGDPRRPAGLHLRAADVLGRVRPGDPAGHEARAARPGSRSGPARGTRSTTRSCSAAGTRRRQAFNQHYDTDVLDSALLRMPRGRLHRAAGPAVAVDPRRDGRRAGHRQPGLPLRPRARRRTGCAGSEGTFSLCTFSYVDALAGAGRAGRGTGWCSRRC